MHRAANGKPLLHPDDPHIVAIASDTAAAAGEGAGDRPRRHRARSSTFCSSTPCRCNAPRPPCGARDGAAHRRLLRVLRAAAAGRRDGAADRRARARRWPRPRRCRSPPRAAACSRADVIAPLDLPPFDNSAVDGYAVRHRDLAAKAETRLAIADRLTAGTRGDARARRRRSDPHLHRRADAGRRRHRVHAGGRAASRAMRVIVPPGLKRGANRRLAGEDVRKGAVVLPAGRRLAAQDVALAAAVGLTDARRAPARAGRAVLDRRRDRRAGHAAAGRRALRRQPLSARAACSSGSAPR